MQRHYAKNIAAALAAISVAGILPGAVFAQDHHNERKHEAHKLSKEIDHRQDTKNDWRNIAVAAGGAGILGLLTKDKTLTFAGAAGALYATNRYEQDRKSQSADARARASLFSHPYIIRDGKRYDRRGVVKNGQHYYRVERH